MMFIKKRSLFVFIIILLVGILSACGGDDSNADNENNENENKENEAQTEDTLTVGYYVNATLGDKSFFDSVKRGVDQAEEELGFEVKTIEGGTNQADWPTGIESMVASKEYDVILLGTSQLPEIVADLAERYPEQKFIFFDDVVDAPNVYSMTYSQSEGSFLAGAFAALVTTNTDLEGTNPDKKIGFIGGMDIPIINDFKAGYEQGAEYIDPDIEIVSSMIGDFADAPKGKELALAQYNSQNVDIIYQVAAAAGLGVLEAGNEQSKYTIGVDDNQNGIHPGSVLTSMMKKLDVTTFNALEKFKNGELEFGTVDVLGIAEDGVGLAIDELYDEHVPQDIRDQMDEITNKVKNGEITVDSILD